MSHSFLLNLNEMGGGGGSEPYLDTLMCLYNKYLLLQEHTDLVELPKTEPGNFHKCLVF